MTFRRLLAVLALGVLIGGCGEVQGFLDDYDLATRPLARVATDISVAATAEDDAAAAREFERVADDTGQVNQRLNELDAPDAAKAEFEDVKAAVRRLERHLRQAAAAARKGDAKATDTAVKRLSVAGKDIAKAQTAVVSKLFQK